MLGACTVPPDGVCKTRKLPCFNFPAHPQMSVLLSLLVVHRLLGGGWAACMAMDEWGKEPKEEMGSSCSTDVA